MSQLIECVPNFSEGRDLSIIKQITDEIEKVEGVKLLDVDPGKATNRTVVTFVGNPDAVIDAAFLAIKKASEIIDMSKHQGEHARMGATDVCPLIPIANISMEETAKYAHKLAQRAGNELSVPIYMYESAATKPERKNLATVRSGEYEGLESKLQKPEWKPDYGPAKHNPKAGATAIGARDFLIAYNINLNTKSTRKANAIAFDVREAGRVKREGHPITGKILRDENGEALRIPGTLKSVKGVGWYIEEYGVAQISMNLTNINITPLHITFDEVVRAAQERGIRVTGSELVGLVPLKCMLDAGKYFLKKQGRSLGVSESEIIEIAVKSLGLDELSPFDPEKKIIEYFLKDANQGKLIGMDLKSFANETASESPAPGGGSISAYVGALGAALSGMVGNLSANKRGWEDRVEEFSDLGEKCQFYKTELLNLVDEDTKAFTEIMNAFKLPKGTTEEKQTRKKAIQDATIYAIEIPLKVMQTAHDSMEYAKIMAEKGNPNSISDAGVGALCARAAVYGAFLNVKINAGDLMENPSVQKMVSDAENLLISAQKQEKEILEIVEKAL